MRKHTSKDRWRGLIQLAADGVCAISRQAQDLQLRITKPLPFALGDALTKGIHLSIRGIATLSGATAGAVLRRWPASGAAELDEETNQASITDNAVSILNGVCGDHLVASNNPLAIDMHILGLAQVNDQAGTLPLVLFVHGLCLNDSHWQDHAVAMQSLGYAPIFLRYNSGKAIADNGAELAAILNQLIVSKQTITIIAHSMGGLVLRHALQRAHAEKHAWKSQLQKILYLGTPHAGAPLEQAGNWVESLWRSIPYAAALAPIARLRSAGIMDLRHGLDESTSRVKRRYQEYAIAANLLKGKAPPVSGVSTLLGDGLVPVASALGQSALQANRIPKSRQHVIDGIGHIDLLHAPAVIAQIKICLAN